MITVAPEQHKFRQQLPGELDIDIGQAQNVIHILARLPVLGDASGLGVVLQCRGEARPLAPHMLDELTVPGARLVAALPPVEYEFRNRILDKGLADIGVGDQYFQRLLTGAPLGADAALLIAAVEKGLMLAPLAHHLLQEL